MTDNESDESRAMAEIRNMSAGVRYHVQHKVRNFLQIIAAQSEEQTDNLLPYPARERFKAIQEAVQALSEDMRRLGL